MKRLSSGLFVMLLLLAGICHAQSQNSKSTLTTPAASKPQPGLTPGSNRPNILFLIMDDVGIDQMRVFGYGGGTPPSTPNIDAIAGVGVKFRNTWSMPECSPSRAIVFEGRYPFRTHVFDAILGDDLANSQVSPFEATTPKVLKSANYTSALFGKFHLAASTYNPFGEATPHSLGWDYFDGFLEGAPHPIDPTIGGQFPSTGPYTCGFVTNADHGGADTGACRFADNSCQMISKDSDHETPGRSCMELGGLFIPNQSCAYVPPKPLDFEQANGYYVWNRLYNEPDGTVVKVPLSDPSARGYVSEATTAAAANWINAENQLHQSWMATVAFANIHTPYQQPPASLLGSGSPDSSNYSCTGNSLADEIYTRVLSNQMTEAMDTEIGDLLVETGLATRNSDGSLHYDPASTNTMVIIIGDNGTFAPGVKAPFDPARAKAWVYQTGVWIPLIVSGPLVASPGREVTSMINVADLFELFGEIAGIDVHQVVPSTHILDSQSMLPYLTNPNQPSIRSSNFTQAANNIHVNNQPPPPCVIVLTQPPTCVQLFTSQGLCESEGGDWYGPGAPQQYSSCCAVQAANLPQYTDGIQLLPDAQWATRNDNYKLVQKAQPNCVNGDTTLTEFYRVNEDPQNPKLDKFAEALCSEASAGHGCPNGLNQEQLANYNQLQSDLQTTLASEPDCPGDGDEDKAVFGIDLQWWQYFSTVNGGGSSWYDFNYDGVTDEQDRAVIVEHLGTNCLQQGAKKTGGTLLTSK
ncbi:MAG: sulfatase-like hydrolase/transferase [Candidatus Korobacteraceae bacterium]